MRRNIVQRGDAASRPRVGGVRGGGQQPRRRGADRLRVALSFDNVMRNHLIAIAGKPPW